MNAYIVGRHSMSIDLLDSARKLMEIWDIKESDSYALCDTILLLGDGAVNPVFYGEEPVTNTDLKIYAKDKVAAIYYQRSRRDNKLMIGINRGAILLAALSGSQIISHAKKHTEGSHWVWFKEFKHSDLLPSNHAQVIYPLNLTDDCYSKVGESVAPEHTYLTEAQEIFKVEKDFEEPEVIYFTNSNAFCIVPDLLAIPIEKMDKNRGINFISRLLPKVSINQLISV